MRIEECYVTVYNGPRWISRARRLSCTDVALEILIRKAMTVFSAILSSLRA